ncbi:hypothetical protein [Agarivorans sp. Alg241-V36]|uniref:hypothetical protein n=1 Tax=Agarivorans sp. Alg241-V36 TaxID=2305992 RepID=UPI0013D86927|nr:hypothetical protein [Agarivorans sp. Alg241-V36]
MSNSYVGWVPTVGGRLSFSIIGNSYTATANRSDCSKRYILSYQSKSLSDSALLPDFIWPFFNKSSKFTFVCSGTASNAPSSLEAPLEGRIVVFDNGDDGISDFESELNKRQHRIQLSDDSLETIQKDIENIISYQVKQAAIAKFDFSLQRDGKVSISNPESKDGLEITPEEYDSLAAQSFFFLKDLCHVHQHHHSQTDTMVDLYRNDSETPWREETIRALYRHVLSFKRNPSIESYTSALGVLAYLKTFISKHFNEENSKEEARRSLILDNDNIEKSILINKERLHYQHDNRRSLKLSTANLFFLLIALVISMSGMGQVFNLQLTTDASNDYLGPLLKFIYKEPITVLSLSITLSAVLTLFVHSDLLSSRKEFKDFVRLFIYIKQRVLGAGLITIGLLVLSVSSYFLFGIFNLDFFEQLKTLFIDQIN